MRSSEWGKFGHRDTERKDHVKIQGEDVHVSTMMYPEGSMHQKLEKARKDSPMEL